MAAKKKSKGKSKRTVLYSRAGKKLYAKRDASGRFEDIQSYQRAHAADLRHTSAAEAAAKAGRPAGKTAKASKAKSGKSKGASSARRAPARQK